LDPFFGAYEYTRTRIARFGHSVRERPSLTRTTCSCI